MLIKIKLIAILQDRDRILFIFIAAVPNVDMTYFRITIPMSSMNDEEKELIFFHQ